MWTYALWCSALALLLGAGTYACIAIWDRQVRREREAARALVEAYEAEARRTEAAERRALAAMTAAERRYRALAEAGAVTLWLADAEGRIRTLGGGWEALTGQPHDAVLGSHEGWFAMLHLDDRLLAEDAWAKALASGEPYEAEFRVRSAGGTLHWCRARAVPILEEADAGNPDVRVLEWVGVIEDIDARRRGEEQRLLLAREANHRAKNVLAVVQAILRMSGGSDPGAAAIMDRITALARVHNLMAETDWHSAGLREVAERELAAYRGSDGTPLVQLSGEPLLLAPAAVQPMAMLLHELATNAAKYGALAANGRVEFGWKLEGPSLVLRWTETGGGSLREPPQRQGFGSRVIDSIVGGQLGGTLDRFWPATGLDCRISLPLSRVIASGGEASRAA